MDSSVCLKSALERWKNKGNITEEIKLIFFISSPFFSFPFLHFRAKMRLLFYCDSYHALHQTRFAVRAAPKLHLPYCISLSEAGCFFVQDPSILSSAKFNLTAMPNVWRRTNPLLHPIVRVTHYSKLLNAGQVSLSLIVIVYVSFVTVEFGSIEERICT